MFAAQCRLLPTASRGCRGPTGVRTAEHSVPLESTENPVAKKEQEPPLDTATDGLEPPSALSDMRESLLQQLKKRKQRAAEEPLDLAKGSPEAIAFTGQRKAADAVAPVDVLTSDALVRDTGDRSTVAWKAVGGSAEDEVFHRVSQRSPQAQCSKDEKDTKLVCLEFCQCVCLSEEPVVSHTHIDIGVPVSVWGACPAAHRPPSLIILNITLVAVHMCSFLSHVVSCSLCELSEAHAAHFSMIVM